MTDLEAVRNLLRDKTESCDDLIATIQRQEVTMMDQAETIDRLRREREDARSALVAFGRLLSESGEDASQ